MMKREMIEIARIYVPVKRRATLEPAKVDALATSILDDGLQMPILVRPDGDRFVLVEGLHRRHRCAVSLLQLGLRLLDHFRHADLPIPVACYRCDYQARKCPGVKSR